MTNSTIDYIFYVHLDNYIYLINLTDKFMVKIDSNLLIEYLYLNKIGLKTNEYHKISKL